jgi:hypothetical protein
MRKKEVRMRHSAIMMIEAEEKKKNLLQLHLLVL